MQIPTEGSGAAPEIPFPTSAQVMRLVLLVLNCTWSSKGLQEVIIVINYLI